MGKTKKTTFKVFDYMHCDDFAKYLERMAAKGWHFKEWGAGLKFEKGEPEQVTYAVEVFNKAKETDLRPEPNTKEFAEYCEAAGWKLVDAKQKFCIFKKVDENAVDILTTEERVENSWKATYSFSAFLLLVLYGINMALQFRNLFGPMFSYSIFSTLSLFNVSVWTFLFLTQLMKFVSAVTVKMKLLKQIKSGREIYIGTNKEGKKRWNGHTFSVMILMMLCLIMLVMLEDIRLVIYYVFLMVGTFAFVTILAKVRPDAETNMIIQVVFTIVYMFLIILIPFMIFTNDREKRNNIENVPLTISDYKEGLEDTDDISISLNKNILGSKEHYWVYREEESISYEIYRSKHSWILNRIWEDEADKKQNENKTYYTNAWEADIAFRNEIGDYYVRYEDSILIFYEDMENELDSGQISIIRDRLELR
ncbi:MAG: DUF2812 domain-containing protein [Lachnospiraceae bacterium]|nr:DUF2812 domain-containing protein [Lachnospiraceae bacterium]